MNKIELGYLIHEALRQTLKEHEKLLKLPHAKELLPVSRRLAGFVTELEAWYSDKYHLKDLGRSFLAKAKMIEAQANKISKKIWKPTPLNLASYFELIVNRRETSKTEKAYPKKIRSQFNNFRLALMEQFSGARLLENNSDLGEETERIFCQYLERRVGVAVRVLRGGHIYDHTGIRPQTHMAHGVIYNKKCVDIEAEKFFHDDEERRRENLVHLVEQMISGTNRAKQ